MATTENVILGDASIPVPPPLPKEKDPTEEMQRKWKAAFREIVDTERAYVNGLLFLERNYIKPLEALNNHPALRIMEQKDFKYCFGQIQLIVNLNKQNLLQKLEQLESGKATGAMNSMSKIFKFMSPFFKTYSEYLANYDDIAIRVKHFTQENPKFQVFMREIEKKTKTDARKSFADYMITPVQRIPRYVLLLRELLRYTDPQNAEHAALRDTIADVENVTKHLNSYVGTVKSTRKMHQLTTKIPNLDQQIQETLLAQHRHFVTEIELCAKNCTFESGKKRIHLVLFNDLIIFHAKNKYVTHLRLADQAGVPWIQLDSEVPTNDVVMVVSKEETKFYRCATNMEATKLVRIINDTVQKNEATSALPRATVKISKKRGLINNIFGTSDNSQSPSSSNQSRKSNANELPSIYETLRGAGNRFNLVLNETEPNQPVREVAVVEKREPIRKQQEVPPIPEPIQEVVTSTKPVPEAVTGAEPAATNVEVNPVSTVIEEPKPITVIAEELKPVTIVPEQLKPAVIAPEEQTPINTEIENHQQLVSTETEDVKPVIAEVVQQIDGDKPSSATLPAEQQPSHAQHQQVAECNIEPNNHDVPSSLPLSEPLPSSVITSIAEEPQPDDNNSAIVELNTSVSVPVAAIEHTAEIPQVQAIVEIEKPCEQQEDNKRIIEEEPPKLPAVLKEEHVQSSLQEAQVTSSPAQNVQPVTIISEKQPTAESPEKPVSSQEKSASSPERPVLSPNVEIASRRFSTRPVPTKPDEPVGQQIRKSIAFDEVTKNALRLRFGGNFAARKQIESIQQLDAKINKDPALRQLATAIAKADEAMPQHTRASSFSPSYEANKHDTNELHRVFELRRQKSISGGPILPTSQSPSKSQSLPPEATPAWMEELKRKKAQRAQQQHGSSNASQVQQHQPTWKEEVSQKFKGRKLEKLVVQAQAGASAEQKESSEKTKTVL